MNRKKYYYKIVKINCYSKEYFKFIYFSNIIDHNVILYYFDFILKNNITHYILITYHGIIQHF